MLRLQTQTQKGQEDAGAHRQRPVPQETLERKAITMDTVLAVGATGFCVEQFRALAAAAGVKSPPRLEGSRLAEAELEALAARFPEMPLYGEMLSPLGHAIKGWFVSPAVWLQLRQEAEQRTGLVARTGATAVAERQPQEAQPTGEQAAPAEQGVGRFDPSPHSSGAPS